MGGRPQWGGPAVALAAALLAGAAGAPSSGPKKGSDFVSFEVGDQDGNSVTLSTFPEQMVFLYWYLQAGTPGCAMEGLGFTTLHPDFAARGIQVLGVSPSSPEENRKFREEYGLPFPLLSDARQSIPRALGVSGRWGALLHPLREGGRKVAMFWPSVNPAEFARNALRLIDRNFPDRVPEEEDEEAETEAEL